MQILNSQSEIAQAEKYMTLAELGVSVKKFSNVTLGKDEVDYMLINTHNLSVTGIICFSDEKPSLKHIGSRAGVLKYAIKKGDIILPHRGRFRSIGVATEDSAIPMVGHHGLMKISCGKENLDLAFFIKDFLQMTREERYDGGGLDSHISIDFINSVKFPISSKELEGYKDASLHVKNMIEMFSMMKPEGEQLRNIILLNAIQQKNDANISVVAEGRKFIEGFRRLKEEYYTGMANINDKYHSM